MEKGISKQISTAKGMYLIAQIGCFPEDESFAIHVQVPHEPDPEAGEPDSWCWLYIGRAQTELEAFNFVRDHFHGIEPGYHPEWFSFSEA